MVILGPTAVGKSEVALELAERFGGEIVSADSRLFYRGMDIGTAKPSLEQRMKVPHHLIDVAEPNETWNIALFQAAANQAIQEIYLRHHLPFMVGGTGQFIRSILDGWSIPPARPNPRLRFVLDRWAAKEGALALHAKLSSLDPQAANSIDPTNVRRTVRALEVIFSTGKRFSDQKLSGHKLYRPLQLGLTRPREELYRRIDDRIQMMLEDGFIAEVMKLLEAGFSPDLPTMSAIGYGELVAYIQGKITIDEAIGLIKRRTRIFVRRQANWFKLNDPNIHWFQAAESTMEEMGIAITHWLYRINWWGDSTS